MKLVGCDAIFSHTSGRRAGDASSTSRRLGHPVIQYSHLLVGSLRKVIDALSARGGAPSLPFYVRDSCAR